MTMTQSHYGPDYDPLRRASSHRAMSTAPYYDRPLPYTVYEQPRQELRSDYEGRSAARAVGHDAESETAWGNSRRRIAVACSRCRRRKIKCSGDPGDGTGCQACRASGTDVSGCTFVRVGSTTLPMTGVSVYPQVTGITSQPGNYGAGSSSVASDWQPTVYQPHHRPTLPTLHTRASFLDGYDQYDSSPVDPYAYAPTIVPRQDSFASSYGSCSPENYRSWSGSSGAMSATSNYYEQHPAYGFGNPQATPAPGYPPISSTWLPSVTTDSFTALNMASLHSSLPTQTVHERRLPTPYAVHYPQTSSSTGGQPPEIRPLGSFGQPRLHARSIPSSSTMPPWQQDSTSSALRAPSLSSLGLPTGLSLPSAYRSTTAAASEPALGYQFNMHASGSPRTSATSSASIDVHPATASSSSAVAILPPVDFRCNSTTAHPLPTASTTMDRPTSASNCKTRATGLYNFGADTGDRPTTSGGDKASGSTASSGTTFSGHNYVPLLQPQPLHASSAEALRRQASFDQQRGATAHRISISNLKGQ